MHYFVLNKSQDYARSASYGCHHDSTGLSLAPEHQQGSFFSRLFDGKETDLPWHRLTCQSSSPLSLYGIGLSLYTSNQPHCLVEGKQRDIAEILKDSTGSPQEKEGIFRPFLQLNQQVTEDILLHGVTGRYLWFRLDFRRQQTLPPVLRNFVLYFPKASWAGYLPGVYQKNPDSFQLLERFLALFQSVYDDVDEAVARNPQQWSPLTCNREFLSFLAELLDIDHVSLWSEEKLRQLLVLAPQLYRKKGTLPGLKALLSLYTGEPAFVVEDTSHRRLDLEVREKQARFYGTDPTEITILLHQRHLQGRKREMIASLIQGMMPVQTQFRLVELRDHVLLGEHTYLGINTHLARYRSTTLDGNTFLDFTTL